MKSFHVTTLGCPKNIADSDLLSGLLTHSSLCPSDEPENADILFINTCGFIEPAKAESLQAIFEAVALKKRNPAKKVYAIGCLSERYRETLIKEIPELDGVFGTEAYVSIFSDFNKTIPPPDLQFILRTVSKPSHYAYLKISEGCDRPCAFCAIPVIRGKHRSRPMASVLAEARTLADKGVRELIIVSQDTSSYGIDLNGQQQIIPLLEALARLDCFHWIRVLYWYPGNFPMKFIELIERFSSIIPYMDIPLQHASKHVLRRMRRAGNIERAGDLIETIRETVPESVFRTAFISGFPGETQDDFKILNAFLEKMRFDRVGVFIYSDEENTPAYGYRGKVSKVTAEKRKAVLMETQRRISEEKNQNLIGTIQEVLIDRYDEAVRYYIGRTFRDAPEIDNEVLIAAEENDVTMLGTFQKVKISGCTEYDLYGTLYKKQDTL